MAHSCPFFIDVTIDSIIAAYEFHGYRLYTKGDYNINIFGIRCQQDIHSNAFNDLLGVLYRHNNCWQLIKADGTTDPGITSRRNPINEKGNAILQPGYYVKAFKLGYHKGQYRALVQNVNFRVWRDNDKDAELDFIGPADIGHFGINLHRANANWKSVEVNNWSAGCQVVADPNDYKAIIDVSEKSAKIYGNAFSYALFEEFPFFQEDQPRQL